MCDKPLCHTLAEQVSSGVVLNRDDPFVARLRTQVRDGVEIRYFGMDADAPTFLAFVAAVNRLVRTVLPVHATATGAAASE